MSPLTKVFVVLVTLLSVVLVALVIPFVAKTRDWQAHAQDLQTELVVAQKKAEQTEQDIQNLYSATSQQVTQLLEQNKQLEAQLQQVTTAQSQAEQATADLRGEIEKKEADISSLTATAAQSSKLLETVSQNLKDAQEELTNAKTRNIRLVDTNTQLQAEVSNLERQVRRLRETMVQLEQQNRQLTAQGGASQGSDETGSSSVLAGKKIAGSITDVENIADMTLVLMDIGQSDGVKQNMKFNIERNGTFVGNLVVETVDTAEASGRVTLKARGSVQPGDRVVAATF